MTNHTTDIPGASLQWAGKPVKPTEVDEVLSYLWHMAADNMRISQNIHVRTSVLNFVICAPDVASAQQASSLLRNLSSTHIGRVILLILNTDRSAPSDVSTWVTLRSFPIISDLMRHHFEQITVMTSGSAVLSSAHIIQPFLKPELPVYLWWLGDPPAQSRILQDLMDSSSRVIVDSQSFSTPEQSLVALSSLLQQSPDSALSDLNWGRITPWRQLVAQFFDAPEYKPYLAGVYHIEVEYAAAPSPDAFTTGQEITSPNPILALLLAGWLKTSLNWRLTADGRIHDRAAGTYSWSLARETGLLHMQPVGSVASKTGMLADSGQGNISIRPRVQSDLPPGSLCLTRLTSTFEGKEAIFTIDRENDANNVLTFVDLPDGSRPPRTVSVPQSQEASMLLHDELEILGREELYEQTLWAVLELLEE